MSNPAALAITEITEHRYVEINNTFEQLTGYSRAEVVGKSSNELTVWVDAANRDNALKLLLEHGALRNWEFNFRKKDGTTGTALLSAELIDLTVVHHGRNGHDGASALAEPASRRTKT